jgi:hypothetical protein
LAALLLSLLHEETTWEEVKKNYPQVTVKEEDDKPEKK